MPSADKLRILHLASHLHVKMGGSIVAAFQIADATHGDGYECVMAGTSMPGSGSEKFFVEGWPRLQVLAFPMVFPHHSFNSWALKTWLRNNASSFDVVHIHGLFNFPYVYGGLAALRSQRPLVISPHNSLDPYDLRKKAWLKRWIFAPLAGRKLIERCAAILCSTDMEASRLDLLNARQRPATRVVPYPVSSPGVVPRDGVWRRKHQLAPDDMVVLFLSRIDRKKGMDLLIEAFIGAAQSRPKLRLVIAGGDTGELATEIKSRVHAAGMDDRVRWVGFLSGRDKVAAYVESDIFALPSYNENFGIVVVEAMYCGTPPLITEEVYLQEILKKKDCAVICQPTIASVRSSLETLIDDGALRQRLAKAGPGVAEAEFGPDAVRHRLREVYSGLVSA